MLENLGKGNNRKMFDFDYFINRPCIGYTNKRGCVEGIFGREVRYIPAQGKSFAIAGDFHRPHNAVDIGNTASITSTEISLYIRDSDMPEFYTQAQQGDHVEVEGNKYQIIDIQKQISTKLILHESD